MVFWMGGGLGRDQASTGICPAAQIHHRVEEVPWKLRPGEEAGFRGPRTSSRAFRGAESAWQKWVWNGAGQNLEEGKKHHPGWCRAAELEHSTEPTCAGTSLKGNLFSLDRSWIPAPKSTGK